MREVIAPGGDEKCPSRCEYLQTEEDEYGMFVYCDDCGTAGRVQR